MRTKMISELLSKLTSELKKASSLGKKMFLAGQTNADLSEALKQLGFQTYLTLKKNAQKMDLAFDGQNEKVKELYNVISQLEKTMSRHEDEISHLKKSV